MVIQLLNREGASIAELVDARHFFLTAVDRWGGFTCLDRVDPYDNVDFEAAEMAVLIAELDELSDVVDRRELEKIVRAVERLARRCQTEGLTLRFSGD